MTLATLCALAVLNPIQIAGDRSQTTSPRTVKVDPTRIVSGLKSTSRTINMRLFSMSYRKAEDEDGKDEPYLLSAGFTLDIAKDLRGFFIGASGIEVFPIRPLDRNNLGYPDNGWARSDRRYRITGHEFNHQVPVEGNMQVVGLMTMLMEEDGWNHAQMRRFAADFPGRLKGCLAEIQKDSVNRPYTHVDEIIKFIGRKVYDMSPARYITFFQSGGTGDSDDTGGSGVALAINFASTSTPKIPYRGVQVTAGGWYPNERLVLTEIRSSGGNRAVNFPLEFPSGNINDAPPKARWKGQAIVAGVVTKSD